MIFYWSKWFPSERGIRRERDRERKRKNLPSFFFPISISFFFFMPYFIHLCLIHQFPEKQIIGPRIVYLSWQCWRGNSFRKSFSLLFFTIPSILSCLLLLCLPVQILILKPRKENLLDNWLKGGGMMITNQNKQNGSILKTVLDCCRVESNRVQHIVKVKNGKCQIWSRSNKEE